MGCQHPDRTKRTETSEPRRSHRAFGWAVLVCLMVIAGVTGGRVAIAQPSNPPSNPPGNQFNTGAGSCDLDFNNDGRVDAADLADFQSVFSEGPCSGCPAGLEPDSIDFNQDGSGFDPMDVEAFAAAIAGGPCPSGWYAQPVLVTPEGTPARWVYWSQARGDDANPGTRELPVASQVRWYQILQQAHSRGEAIAGVLFRGEHYSQAISGEYGAWKLSGTAERPIYIMADPQQDVSLPRPLIDVGGDGAATPGGDGIVLYAGDIRLIGLHVRNSSAVVNPQGPGGAGYIRRGNGITVYGKGEEIVGRVVIDDCLVELFGGNIKIQGEETGRDNLRHIVINRSAFVGAWAEPGDAQGMFLSRVSDSVVRESVLFANGYNLARGAHPTLRNHNAYIVPNCRGVRFVGVVTGHASATNLQLRGGPGNVADGVVSINGPLGITGGHTEAPAHLDWGGGIVRCLIYGGGSVGTQRRSLSVGLNRARGVLVQDTIVWRDEEGLGLVTPEGVAVGAAYWLQGPTPQDWTIDGNLVYDPLLPVGGPTLAVPGPALRDDRVAGAVPARAGVLEGTRFARSAAELGIEAVPRLTTYLDQFGVNVFDPQMAGQAFVVQAAANRRGNWKREWTAEALQGWWRERLEPAE
jgi:hypothetical protein